MSDLLTYTRFYSLNEAKPLIELLEKENIPYKIDHEINQLDSVYIGQSLDPMFALKIPQDQFSKLNFILGDKAEESHIDSDYYLFSFTDDELKSVIQEPDEWNAFDRSLAQKILMERKVDIPKIVPASAQKYQPEKLNTQWVILGYILGIFPFLQIVNTRLLEISYALCLVPISDIFFGLAIVNGRKTLSSGEKVFIYEQGTKRHGYNFIILGCIGTLLQVIYFIWLWDK